MRHLQLRVLTPRGLFGADIPFSEGLMVLRADNSRGKSTAIKSILFALGMERMIAGRAANSVTAAMRDHLIFDPATKAETTVLESFVRLEVRNTQSQTVTLTRWVKHSTISDGLVRVTHGGALSSPGNYTEEDFYVGRSGSVSNPRGFHGWLARFIGWEMPELPARDGRSAPLYMEQVFPLLLVEQRRGWGGIQAQMPYFSGVSDVRRRSIEFLLGLEAGRRELERQRLNAEYAELEASWKSAMSIFSARLEDEGLVLSGVPAGLSLTWPPSRTVSVLASQDDRWISLDSLLNDLKRQELEYADSSVRPVGDVSESEERQLESAIETADRLQQASAILREDLIRDRAELASMGAKIDALREDHRQYQDVLVLERLGSPTLLQMDRDCPVCHQDLPPSLLGHVGTHNVMSPADTVSYIKQQIDLFTVMSEDSQRAFAAKRERWAALRREAAAARAEIRRLRTDLTQSDSAPSIEQVAEKVLIQQRIERLQRIQEEFHGLQGELMRLSESGVDVKTKLDALPKDRLTGNDRLKLNLLERSFVEQLREYDFGSFSDERLAISVEDYLPRRDDFDLQADISASDSIRVVWAYLIGLMEIARSLPTNHPGFLVFDEPRQQSTKGLSFEALLRRAARQAEGHQIIFATSEELDSLRSKVSNIPCTLHVVDNYLLQPVNE